MRRKKSSQPREEPKAHSDATEVQQQDTDLTPLFRVLMRQPAKDHDSRTCPICKRYNITEI